MRASDENQYIELDKNGRKYEFCPSGLNLKGMDSGTKGSMEASMTSKGIITGPQRRGHLPILQKKDEDILENSSSWMQG